MYAEIVLFYYCIKHLKLYSENRSLVTVLIAFVSVYAVLFVVRTGSDIIVLAAQYLLASQNPKCTYLLEEFIELNL